MVGCRCWYFIYPGSAAIWRNSKTLRLSFRFVNYCAHFLGACWRCAHYDENHYSGAIWLLYVMICAEDGLWRVHVLVNYLANISWRIERFSRVKR